MQLPRSYQREEVLRRTSLVPKHSPTPKNSELPPISITACPADAWQSVQSDIVCLCGISLSLHLHIARALQYSGVHFKAIFPEWTHADEPSDFHARHEQEHSLSIFNSSPRLTCTNQLTACFRDTLEDNGGLRRSGMLDQRGPLSCQLSAQERRKACLWPTGYALSLSAEQDSQAWVLVANALIGGYTECFLLCRAVFAFMLACGCHPERETIVLCTGGPGHRDSEVNTLLSEAQLVQNDVLLHSSLPAFIEMDVSESSTIWISKSSRHAATRVDRVPESDCSGVTLVDRHVMAKQSGWYVM